MINKNVFIVINESHNLANGLTFTVNQIPVAFVP